MNLSDTFFLIVGFTLGVWATSIGIIWLANVFQKKGILIKVERAEE